MSVVFRDRESAYPNRYIVTPENGGAYYATLQRADDPVVAGTPLNAETFEALMRELRAYSDAYNLLDNSNFANPVNQRGGSLYSGANQYTVDRWYATNKLDVSVDTGYVNLTCSSDASARNGFTQHLAPEKTPVPGTVITVAYEDDEGNLSVASGKMPKTGSLSLFSSSGFGVNLYSAEPTARLSVMVPPDSSHGLKWICLYEGEYTEHTLPKYRPKDYSAELMECMRYYQVRSSGNVPEVDLRPHMVTYPTITPVEMGYAYIADIPTALNDEE